MSQVAQRMAGWQPEESTPGEALHPLDEAIRGGGDPDAAMVGRLLLKLSQWNEHEGRWAKCACETCVATSPWNCLLGQLRPKVDEAEGEVQGHAERFKRLLASQRGASAQTAGFVFLWLSDAMAHPLVNKCAFQGCGESWPWEICELPESVAKFLYGNSLPELSPTLLPDQGDEKGANELLRRYLDLTDALSSKVLAQLRVCTCPSSRDLNAFSKESLEVRREYGWSIPSQAAVERLASLGPLLEIGGGTGYWASLIREAGGDIKCFNSGEWRDDLSTMPQGEHLQCGVGHEARFGEVLAGGPEQIALHPDRALVLMWPDYLGQGAFGLECLEAFEGETLLLVGEWQGRTYGGYMPGLGQHGQSFSQEFQAEVASLFVEEAVLRLPNWPLFADVLMVFRRKSLQELMSGADPVGGIVEGDFLANFFSGQGDGSFGLGLEDCEASAEWQMEKMAIAGDQGEEGEGGVEASPSWGGGKLGL